MKPAVSTAFIETIREYCRMCYTCVRECPGKAIRIVEGQADVVPERCIACGNCVKVCSQKAKRPVSTIDEVEQLLASGVKVAACIAPSFPAEFTECNYRHMVGMLRALGFHLVCEVGFGADLIADRYHSLFQQTGKSGYIATTCPAVVGYVERYHPELVKALAPIVSPMVAMARVLREIHGPQLAIVFIGPCIAKKVEACSEALAGEIDAALTFAELRQMLLQRAASLSTVSESDFDPPHPHLGSLFAISRGLLQAARLEEDLVSGQVVATKGRANFLESLREFADGNLDAKLLEVLCCQGCIMGPGLSKDLPLFPRRSLVSRYVRSRVQSFDQSAWEKEMQRFQQLNLQRSFASNDQRLSSPAAQDLRTILASLGKNSPEDELNCGACGYDTCQEHAVAICKGLAETEMCLPYTIEKLRQTVNELAESHEKLADTQKALMQSEKMASMGQLAAGIAHEVNNPLGVVLMYAHLLLEQAAASPAMQDDLKMIVEQADRCKKIVAGLLHFARQNKVLRQPNDFKHLIDRSLLAVTRPPGVQVEIRHHCPNTVAEVDGDQMIQVLTNLISNACAAMPQGGTLSIETSGDEDTMHVVVRDSGVGIPPENRKKVFEPFFTTKQIGKGTGLGLAVVYGIIKMHKGDIHLESNNDPHRGPTGSAFHISFSRSEGSLG